MRFIAIAGQFSKVTLNSVLDFVKWDGDSWFWGVFLSLFGNFRSHLYFEWSFEIRSWYYLIDLIAQHSYFQLSWFRFEGSHLSFSFEDFLTSLIHLLLFGRGESSVGLRYIWRNNCVIVAWMVDLELWCNLSLKTNLKVSLLIKL